MNQQQSTTGIVSAPQRRLGLLLALRGVLWLWCAAAACLALIIISDVLFILDAPWRARSGLMVGAAAAVAAVLAAWSLRRLRGARLARHLEGADPSLGSALSNAVALKDQTSKHPLTEYLRQESLRYGAQQARRARIWPLAKPSLILSSAAALLLILWWVSAPLLAPHLMAAVWPRFSDPFGDHPPYSHLTIIVEPEDHEVLYGGSLEVRARVDGGAVDRLMIFTQADNAEAGELTQAVMFRRPDGGYVQTLTNVRHNTLVWVGDGRARSRRQQIQVRRTPQITMLEAHIRYPEYTRLADDHQVLDDQELRLPRGSEVRLQLASNRPLADGTVTLQPLDGGESKTVPLQVVDDQSNNLLHGHFGFDESVAYEITVRDIDGLRSQHPRRGRLLMEPDRPPRLQVIDPGRDAISTPDMDIAIEVQARDDYGINSLHWLRSVNASLHDVGNVPITYINDNPARAGLRQTLPLADLGLRPGDRIEYIYEVMDNNPDNPQLATSVPYVIDIISEEDYRKAMARQRQGGGGPMDDYLNLAQTARRMHERANALAEDLKAGSEPETIAQQISILAEDLERYHTLLERLAERALENPLSQALDQRIAELLPGFDAATEAMHSLSAAGPEAAAAADAQALAAALDSFADDMAEQVSEPARQIDLLHQLTNTARAFDQLIDEQLLIAQWSRRFLDDQQDDERLSRMQLTSLADHQQRLLDNLTRWLEDMAEAISAMPDDPVYDPLLLQADALRQRVADAGIAVEQRSAIDYFEALQGDEGHLAALRAWRLMQESKTGDDGDDLLQQLCEGAGECLSQLPGLGSMPGDALRELMLMLEGRGRGWGGPGEGSGYSSLSSNRAVYGPDTTGEQSGRGETESSDPQGSLSARRHATDDRDHYDPSSQKRSSGVRLRPDLPFPLRYRILVGDYFRAVAEGAGAESQQPPF